MEHPITPHGAGATAAAGIGAPQAAHLPLHPPTTTTAGGVGADGGGAGGGEAPTRASRAAAPSSAASAGVAGGGDFGHNRTQGGGPPPPGGGGGGGGGSGGVVSTTTTTTTTASGVSILLSDWSRFGLAERVWYHFDLIETLTPSKKATTTNDAVVVTTTPLSEKGETECKSSEASSVAPASKTATARKAKNSASEAAPVDPKGGVSVGWRGRYRKPCGVAKLLECVPSIPPEQLSTARRRQLRRNLRLRHREFNAEAHRAMTIGTETAAMADADAEVKDGGGGEGSDGDGGLLCHRPAPLPLPLSTNTRVAFAYELTCVVLCVDASPSLTSASLLPPDDPAVCAIDNLRSAAGRYLSALVEPVSLSNADASGRRWIPEIAVTVVAVYSQRALLEDRGGARREEGGGDAHDDDDDDVASNTNVLVKDYRIHDAESVSVLVRRIDDWALREVESGIASRMNRPHATGYPRDVGGGSPSSSSSSSPHLPQSCSPAVSCSSVVGILEACDAALDTLPPEGRPCVALASTCRSVRCDHLVDFASDPRWRDVPVHVLDLSSSSSKFKFGRDDGGGRVPSPHGVQELLGGGGGYGFHHQGGFYDGGPSSPPPPPALPLSLSDDREALHDFSAVTGGCYLDSDLLDAAAATRVGQVGEPFHRDYYLAFRRRTLRPNALQWYTLFQLSPLTPLSNAAWGRPPPPRFLRSRGGFGDDGPSSSAAAAHGDVQQQQQRHHHEEAAHRHHDRRHHYNVAIAAAAVAAAGYGDGRRGGERGANDRGGGGGGGATPPSTGSDTEAVAHSTRSAGSALSRMVTYTRRQSSGLDGSVQSIGARADVVRSPRKEMRSLHVDGAGMSAAAAAVAAAQSGAGGMSKIRTSFSIYSLSPVRVKGMLLMRFLEGFRTKKYGYATQYNDKVSIHLTLPTDCGLTVHYELSFVSSPNHDPMVGSAHVKVELSGPPELVQMVKNDFISHQTYTQTLFPSGSAVGRTSGRLCRFLRWIRKEDCLESYLCPLEFGVAQRPLSLRRLETLTSQQRQRHFRVENVEVVCVGGVDAAFGAADQGILGEFIAADHGEGALLEGVASWSTKTIDPGRLYMKSISPGGNRDGGRLPAYCFVDVAPSPIASRLLLIKVGFYGVGVGDRLAIVRSLEAFIEPVGDVVVLPRPLSRHLVHRTGSTARARAYYHHESWELVKDSELLPLLTRRRTQIGNFWLVDVSERHAVFVKYVSKLLMEKTDHNEEVAVSERTPSANLSLLQYQVSIGSDHVTVDLYMETTAGYFAYYNNGDIGASTGRSRLFNVLCENIRRRDLDCGRALNCRSRLLTTLQSHAPVGTELYTADRQADDVNNLLLYSSRLSKRLRFFGQKSSLGNEILANLTARILISDAIHGVQVAKLDISSNVAVGDQETGEWFIIRHDSSTITIVGFSNVDHHCMQDEGAEMEAASVYRTMNFFTFGIGDLYSTKDDVTEDDTDEDDASEHLEDVSEIAQSVEVEHRHNFARSAYLALRKASVGCESHVDIELCPEEFAYAMSSCCEIEIARAFISDTGTVACPQAGRPPNTWANLSSVLAQLLKPVPGVGSYFYFYETETEHFASDVIEDARRKIFRRETVIDDQDDSYSEEHAESTDNEDDTIDSEGKSDADPTNAINVASVSSTFPIATNDSEQFGSIHPPPLFVCFHLDGKAVSCDEISQMDRSAHLTAFITVWDRKDAFHHELPKIHSALAIALRSKLDAFVASQTLERLRHFGPSLSDVDIKIAMKCLVEAEHVSTRTVYVEFFSAKSNSMVSATSFNEEGLVAGFSLFTTELSSGRFIKVKRAASDAFYVMAGDRSLPFWAFLHGNRRRGCICVNVHHPSGVSAGERIADELEDAVRMICRRVNQLLLLESLHLSRSAHQLLIPDEAFRETQLDQQNKLESFGIDEGQPGRDPALVTNYPGHFACPLVFGTSFPLNHRCRYNQVVLSLESSVLHQFAVSNRSGVFVYKDELGHIFYMMLRGSDRSLQRDSVDESIELVVHGVETPGDSIKVQLCRLLRKKLMNLAVDALSGVLTKNPQYSLLPEDTKFINSYASIWNRLEAGEHGISSSKPQEKDRIYEFPLCVYDPVMVLLYFRQNISGSTYFHRLHESGDHSVGGNETSEGDLDRGQISSRANPGDKFVSRGVLVAYVPRSFSLFYNNTPTYLADSQAVSTLTKKGKNLSRQTGTGVALINLFLLNKDCTPVDLIEVGAQPTQSKGSVEVPLTSIRMKPWKDNKSAIGTDVPTEHAFRLCVEIVNTTLNLSVLHQWIELSLNQALVGWCIERHFERSRLGLIPPFVPDKERRSSLHHRHTRRMAALEPMQGKLDSVCPGLPALTSMLQASHLLPHPAVERVESNLLLRATTLARLTLDLLERAILGVLLGEKASSISMFSNVAVMRCKSMGARFGRVRLIRRQGSGEVTTIDYNSGRVVRDGPVDSPEYTCCLGLRVEEGIGGGAIVGTAITVPETGMVFREVFIDSLALKASRRSAFVRSLSFVLTVSRSTQSLLTYNWHPSVVQEVRERFKEIEEKFLTLETRVQNAQQARCLKSLAIPQRQERNFNDGREGRGGDRSRSTRITGHSKDRQIDDKPATADHSGKDPKMSNNGSKPAQGKKIARPTTIRRPTLIGRSVEGAAVQAVLASRARASSRPVHVQRKASSAQSASMGKSSRALPASQREGVRTKQRIPQREKKESTESPKESDGTRTIPVPVHRRTASASSSTSTGRKAMHQPGLGERGRKDSGDSLLSPASTIPAPAELPSQIASEAFADAYLLQTPVRRSFDGTDISDNSADARNRTKRVSLSSRAACTETHRGTAFMGLLRALLQARGFGKTCLPSDLCGATRLPLSVVVDLINRFDSDCSLLLTILPFANQVRTLSCELLPLIAAGNVGQKHFGEISSGWLFLKHYVRVLETRLGATVIRSNSCTNVTRAHNRNYEKINFHERSHEFVPIFLQTHLKISSSAEALAVLELSLRRCDVSGKLIVRCRVWVIAQQRFEWARPKKLRVAEKTRATIDELINRLCGKLHLQSEIFNYASVAVETCIDSNCQGGGENIGVLVREMAHKFPIARQKWTLGMKYRVYRRVLPRIASARSLFGDSGALMTYVCSCSSNYNMMHAGAEQDRVLMGRLNGVDTNEKKCLDVIVSSPNSVFIQLRSESIQNVAEKLVCCTLTNAALCLRRLVIWGKFSQSQRTIGEPPTLNELQELCASAYLLPITESDERLASFVSNNAIDWSAVFETMESDQNVSTFDFLCNDNSRRYLLRCHGIDDAFVVISMNSKGFVEGAHSILKAHDGNMAESLGKRKQIVEMLTNWLLHWIWHRL